MFNIPRGTKDVLPSEAHKWHFIEKKASEIASLYGAEEIRTPIFEHTELFLRGVGETTDVVSKEMYTFLDKGDRSITLKPEGTASVVRSLIENSLDGAKLPLKMYYITPVFRYETPQAGRLRQHTQFGVEYFGASCPGTDAELISLAYNFLTSVGVTDISLQLNSIGCQHCRQKYKQILIEYFADRTANLCANCNLRMEKNPLRMLDCKNPKCKDESKDAPSILDTLCGECSDHFEQVKSLLNMLKIPFEINPKIVRGLDYYNRTVFEFTTDAIGAKGTVCGGGRYDNLVQSMGGKELPAMGFGLGLERLLMVIDAHNLDFVKPSIELFIAFASAEQRADAFLMADCLRKLGVSSQIDLLSRSLKSQIKFADKSNAKYLLVLGENEVNSRNAVVRNLSSGKEQAVSLDNIEQLIKAVRS